MMEILTSDDIPTASTRIAGSHCTCLQTSRTSSKLLSKFVCKFIEAKNDCDKDFDLLTNIDSLPNIDLTVASALIVLEDKVKGGVVDIEKKDSCLKKRCFQSIRLNLLSTDIFSPSNEVIQFLRKHPSELAVTTLVECMKQLKGKRGTQDDVRVR